MVFNFCPSSLSTPLFKVNKFQIYSDQQQMMMESFITFCVKFSITDNKGIRIVEQIKIFTQIWSVS